ncbi:MAG TPA: hypothetical protein VKF79_00855, partial [Candidatus Acidoferrum sp.]|nr:hypothetical protein [Candidatus Acidoferrum sp.]
MMLRNLQSRFLGAGRTGEQNSPNQFIANTATVLAAQVGRAGISLLLEVVYARLLGPAGRGQMSLCAMVIG